MEWNRILYDDGADGAATGGEGGGSILTETASAATPAEASSVESGEPVDSSWFSGLSEADQKEPSIARFQNKSLSDFANSYKHANSLAGKKGVIPPGPNATPEEISEFHQGIGRPETVDKYSTPENLAADVDEASMTAFKDAAFKAGLTDHQAAAMVRFQTDMQKAGFDAQAKASEEQQNEGLKVLRREWADAFDKRLSVAQETLRQFDPDGQLKAMFEETGVGNNPTMIRFLADVGVKFGEDVILGGKGRETMGVTPADAAVELAAMKADQGNRDLLNNKQLAQDPGRKALLAKMQNLANISNNA